MRTKKIAAFMAAPPANESTPRVYLTTSGREYYADLLGLIAPEQRTLRSIQALVAKTANCIGMLDEFERQIEADGVYTDGKAHPLIAPAQKQGATVAALISRLKLLPQVDPRSATRDAVVLAAIGHRNAEIEHDELLA